MKICIPVDEDRGLESPVCAHFGSAPLFVIADTDSGHLATVANGNRHHGHGMCQPLAALDGHQVDGVVVGGIGARALARLQAAGKEVFLSRHTTVEQTLAALREGGLESMTPALACAQHGRGHGHG
jgi:predicted Fe-Mo cluster-binding NifX family protein